MSVNINFPADVETTLRHRAAAAGKDLATYVQDVVAESLLDGDQTLPHQQSTPIEFERRLNAWIALHPVLDHAIDDSRESIYAGRGE